MSYIIIVQQNETDLALNADHIVYFEPIRETSKTTVFLVSGVELVIDNSFDELRRLIQGGPS